MKLKDLVSFLDSAIPLSFQEGYDNSGLQVGSPEREVSSALICLDVTEEVLNEAAYAGCDVIISHHPLVFTAIKQLTGRTAAERLLLKAVKQDIAVYSAHTNLDVVENGVSSRMADKLGLVNRKVLVPLRNRLLKLVTFVPEVHAEEVREAVFNAGAGVIGRYDRCSFLSPGTGSFRAGEGTSPFTGEKGKDHFEKEVRLETVLFSHLKGKVIRALVESHPYEEPAYDLYPLENENIAAGLGCTGELKEALDGKEFLAILREIFGARGIRHSALPGRNIRKVALCGGAGGSLTGDAISSGADAYVTGDIRYHTFFEAEGKILLTDIGHYESEKFSAEILYGLITKKFPTFAVRFSEVNTNPINYF
ncbi:MAG: Nif3-like dinuclear metal center hexameric protein [Bacteroidales bacterium]|jgi:dinuclear metal center YbgI/SA1388 family protein|nr:Nif3-like dinuclear metal center hexameric protein [Bacteroidales bacterium]